MRNAPYRVTGCRKKHALTPVHCLLFTGVLTTAPYSEGDQRAKNPVGRRRLRDGAPMVMVPDSIRPPKRSIHGNSRFSMSTGEKPSVWQVKSTKRGRSLVRP